MIKTHLISLWGGWKCIFHVLFMITKVIPAGKLPAGKSKMTHSLSSTCIAWLWHLVYLTIEIFAFKHLPWLATLIITLYIYNHNNYLFQSELEKLFSSFGNIITTRILCDTNTCEYIDLMCSCGLIEDSSIHTLTFFSSSASPCLTVFSIMKKHSKVIQGIPCEFHCASIKRSSPQLPR